MTDPVFQEAEHQARARAHWLARANETTRCAESLKEFPRSRCLQLARKAEARITELAERAELHARIEFERAQ